MARAVGLDIGSRTIKVVELSGSAKSFKVVQAAIRDIPQPEAASVEGEPPPDPEQLASDIVRELFHDLKLPREDVCATFSSGDTLLREITIPFQEDDQIRKVVKFEAENHLHSYSLEEVVVNWIKTGQNRDGSRLTVFASPKEEVARTIGIIRTAGVEPSSMDLDATAVFTAYDAAGVFRDSPNVVLIDVGAKSTTLILVAEGRPQTMRSFRLGADHVVARAGRELGMAPDEIRERVTLPEGPHPDDLLAPASALTLENEESEKSLTQIEDEAMAEHRENFVRKLHLESIRSLATLREGMTPDRILLSGGGSLLPGLRESLEERFGLPVERADLSKKIDWRTKGDLGDPEQLHAVTPAAVGSALRLLGFDPLGVELLQDEFAPTNRFDVIKNALATGVTLLFLVLLGLAILATFRRNMEQHRHSYAVSRARLLYKEAEKAYITKVDGKTEAAAEAQIAQTLKRTPADDTLGTTLFNRLRSRYNTLQRNLGLRRDIPEVPSAVEAWLEIAKALNAKPREDYGLHFRLSRMEVTARDVRVWVEVDAMGMFDRVRRQFEDSDYFKRRARAGQAVEMGPVKSKGGLHQTYFYFRLEEESGG